MGMCLPHPDPGPIVVWVAIPDAGIQDTVVLEDASRHSQLLEQVVELLDAATWSPEGELADPLVMWPTDRNFVDVSNMELGPQAWVPNYLILFLEAARCDPLLQFNGHALLTRMARRQLEASFPGRIVMCTVSETSAWSFLRRNFEGKPGDAGF